MSKTKKFLIFLLIFLVLVAPVLSFASTPLVTCTNNCKWNDLMNTINTVINFLIFSMALPIAAIMFAYAGFMIVTSGGSTERRGLAKKVFTNAVFGFILAIACWLIVHTVLTTFGYDGSWIGL